MRWRLVDALSRTLDPDEREAVLGDFEESGETRGKVRDLFGLVARRQAELWNDWRPWLALVSLAIPLGFLLARTVQQVSDGSAIYSWMYINNWTMTYLENAGFRLDLFKDATNFLLEYAALIFWSWTVGFVLGSLSRRAIWINGAAFCALLFGEIVAVHSHGYAANAAPFALGFYRLVLPLILRIGLVLIPALSGMVKGARLMALSLRQMALWAAVLIALTAWGHLSVRWGPRLVLLIAFAWPVVYMFTTADWKRWREE
jgi:hypothetical protein